MKGHVCEHRDIFESDVGKNRGSERTIYIRIATIYVDMKCGTFRKEKEWYELKSNRGG